MHVRQRTLTMDELVLSITAPSRIHFGLFGGKNPDGNSFGGLGAMVQQPGMELTIAPNDKRVFTGPQANRLEQFTNYWLEFTRVEIVDEFQLELAMAPPSHIGLGTGTQLGLCVATLLFQYHYGQSPSVDRLAASTRRGGRSSVGTYGFLHGGLIVDRGKAADQDLATMDLHLKYPENWRFVLIQTDSDPGMSGLPENDLFGLATEKMVEKRNSLIKLVKDEVVPAILKEDFNAFSHSIYEFGKLSGSYFSQVQGGPFNGKRITQIIERARAEGIPGVGQSSWGPTIYALAESQTQAEQIREWLVQHLNPRESVTISKPSNLGARLTDPRVSRKDFDAKTWS